MSKQWLLAVLASSALACPVFAQERVAAERSTPPAKVFVTYDFRLDKPLMEAPRQPGSRLPTSAAPEETPSHRRMLEETQPLELVPFEADDEV